MRPTSETMVNHMLAQWVRAHCRLLALFRSSCPCIRARLLQDSSGVLPIPCFVCCGCMHACMQLMGAQKAGRRA